MTKEALKLMQSKWDSGPIILIYPINIYMDLSNTYNEIYYFKLITLGFKKYFDTQN
jgi:hypothetical protein